MMDPQHWKQENCFDPLAATVVREPPGAGEGYWIGAPGAMYDSQDKWFYLVYRLRRPRGVEPDRGAEIQIARSRDGIEFETIWQATKDLVDSPSIERCALRRRADGSWILYISYVDPSDGRWRIDLVRADQPDQFDLREVTPVLTAADIGAEGVKDPFLFSIGSQWGMIASYAYAAGNSSDDQLHGTADAYNTGLILSATGLALSDDGLDWQWQGQIMGPSATGWDQYCSRIGCVWRERDTWLALYDGSASVEENYEERVGLSWSWDLKQFHRLTPEGPLLRPPVPGRALRYFDVLDFPDQRFTYFEMARPDGSHDLRVIHQQSE
jgi:hypothetical protein